MMLILEIVGLITLVYFAVCIILVSYLGIFCEGCHKLEKIISKMFSILIFWLVILMFGILVCAAIEAIDWNAFSAMVKGGIECL